MKNAIQEVENYLKSDRTLMAGRNLYNKLPGKSLAVQNSLSRLTSTPKNLKLVWYELAKLVGISQRKLTILTNKPITVSNTEASESENPVIELTLDDKLISFSKTNIEYTEAKVLAHALNLPLKNKKKTTVFTALEEARKTLVLKTLKELPQDIKASIKLRDQFPFLRDKECPDVLKLIVNDLITCYETFKENQPRVHDLLDESTTKLLVETLTSNYISNKEAYAELEHYKSTQTILGVHPVFKRLELKEEITKMTTTDLTKKIHSLTTNLTRNRTKNNKELVDRDQDLLNHANKELAKR